MKKVMLLACLLVGMTVQAQTNELPSNVIKLRGGLDFVTSKVYLEANRYQGTALKASSWRAGVGTFLQYEHFLKRGFGFGLDLYYHDTRYSQEGHQHERLTAALRSIYIGPSFAYSLCFKNHWRFDSSIGMGYGYVSGDLADNSGLGIKLRAGIEYMVTPHFGVGVDLYELYVFTKDDSLDDFKKMYPSESNIISGVSHLGLAAGMTFYF